MSELILGDDQSKRFITCFYHINDGKLKKEVKIFTTGYRQRVVNHLISKYKLQYIYMEDDDYTELDIPHMKYCREMNTESDDYHWYKKLAEQRALIESLEDDLEVI